MEIAQRNLRWENGNLGDTAPVIYKPERFFITIASIDTTTGGLTVDYSADYSHTDHAIIFPKRFIPDTSFSMDGYSYQQTLPEPLVNELYYIKYGTPSKIYGNMADWTANTNPIIFTLEALRARADIDAGTAGLTPKLPCRAATTANITLSGTQTIDGITLIAGDRVLVKNQTAGANNGIYEVAAGAWARAYDFSYGKASTQTPFIATNENQVLSGTLDPVTGLVRVAGGRSLTVGSEILLMNQTDPRENDSWFVSSGAWSRGRVLYPTDYDITRPQYFEVGAGTYAGQWFTINLDVPITIGTTPITIEATTEPIARYIDNGFTFILEGTTNKQKGFYLTTTSARVGITSLVFADYSYFFPAGKLFFDYAVKKYPMYFQQYTDVRQGFGSTVSASLYTKMVNYAAADVDDVFCCPALTSGPSSPVGLVPGSVSTTLPMPTTLTMYMPSAYMIKTSGNLSFVTPAKIMLGDINITLTYNAKSSLLASELLTFYEIPGRFFYSPVPKYNTAVAPDLWVDTRSYASAPPVVDTVGLPRMLFSHQHAARKRYQSPQDYNVFYSNDYYISSDSLSAFISSLPHPFAP